MSEPHESIEGIVDREGENLSPEERARLTERLGMHFVRRLIRMDNQSRDDELIRFEDYARREAPLLKRDRDHIAEYLLLRRAELSVRNEDFSEIAEAVNEAQMGECLRLLAHVSGLIESDDNPEQVVNHVLDYIAARRQELRSPGATYDDEDSCTVCGEHLSDPHAPDCPHSDDREGET